MPAIVVVDVRGIAGVKQMFGKLDDKARRNRERKGLRAAGKVFRTAIRTTARTRSDLPRTFQKTRSREHQRPDSVSVRPASPLVAIYEGGAKPHDISPSRGLLSNATALGRGSKEQAFVAAGTVHHPGMGARPLVGPVWMVEHEAAADVFVKTFMEDIV